MPAISPNGKIYTIELSHDVAFYDTRTSTYVETVESIDLSPIRTSSSSSSASTDTGRGQAHRTGMVALASSCSMRFA